MKNRITLYALSTCRNCAALKKVLDDIGIPYKEIVCDDPSNSYVCDDIENLIDCQLYPIVKITKKVEKEAGGYFVYKDENLVIHYCNDHADLLLKKKLTADSNAICVTSYMDMIDLIHKHI